MSNNLIINLCLTIKFYNMSLVFLLVLSVLTIPMAVYTVQTKKPRFIIAMLILLGLWLSLHYFVIWDALRWYLKLSTTLTIYTVVIALGIVFTLLVPNFNLFIRYVEQLRNAD
jgi:hypothetical protein